MSSDPIVEFVSGRGPARFEASTGFHRRGIGQTGPVIWPTAVPVADSGPYSVSALPCTIATKISFNGTVARSKALHLHVALHKRGQELLR